MARLLSVAYRGHRVLARRRIFLDVLRSRIQHVRLFASLALGRS
jgi:hypothetical protein